MSLTSFGSLKRAILQKNYRWFSGPWNLNLIGIRSADMTPNVFNDRLCVAYVDEQGQPQLFTANITTDPGLYWLHNPENIDGTAILKEGQYLKCWEIGTHKGKYKALVQVAPMTVYRDANRDSVLNLITGTEETGLFGIEYHFAGNDLVPEHNQTPREQVEKWSAGCQVANVLGQYLNSFLIFEEQARHGHGDKFSYTLLNERDLRKAG